MHAANNASHAVNVESNGCKCICHLYKVSDGIQVTPVSSYCGERQG